VRLIKATVLEHGDDIESAISFLLDNFEQEKGSTLQVLDLIENYKSFLSLNTQAEQINPQLIEAETPLIPNAESQVPVQLDYGSWVNEGILNSDGMFVNPEKEAEAQFRSPEMSSEYVECEQSGITGCYDGASIAKTSENEHTFSEADHTEQSESDGSHNAVVTGTECVTESYHEATMTSIKELSTTSLEEIVIQAHKDKVWFLFCDVLKSRALCHENMREHEPIIFSTINSKDFYLWVGLSCASHKRGQRSTS
jgi:hypothetical protein